MNQKKNKKFEICQKKLDLYLDEDIQIEVQKDDEYYIDKANQYKYFHFSIPKYNYHKNGKACVFLLGKSTVQGFGNLDNFYEQQQFNEELEQYKSLTQNFNKKVSNKYCVKRLVAHIDFSYTCINNIQEFATSLFDINNLQYLTLCLFVDELLMPQAINFVQSVLNLETLEQYYIVFFPKQFGVFKVEYLNKIQKQLEFKSHINKQEIIVNDQTDLYGFTIFSDQGKINKLFFYDFIPIELDIQQLESVINLEIESRFCAQMNQMNDFLKKLKNLKYLKVGINNLEEYDEQYGIQQCEILQTISQLEKIKNIELDCRDLSPQVKQLTLQQQNLERLDINFGDSIIPIHSSTLSYLQVTFYPYEKTIDQVLIKKSLSTINKLKVLKIYNIFQFEMYTYLEGLMKELEMRQLFSKYFKRLVKLCIYFELDW